MNILDSFRLDGKTACVTGAGRGIGRACALALAEAGADVAVIDVDPASANETAQAIQSLGRRAMADPCDVTRPDQVEAVFARIRDDFGGVDIAFNNAGICINADAQSMSDEQWRRVTEVNLDGVFYCSRAAGRMMIAAGSEGRIINTASMSGTIVNRPQPQCGYNAAKAAVIHLSRSLACEWAPFGITVNTISPGYTATRMTLQNDEHRTEWERDTPLRRLATPEEITGAVVFLASPASKFVTGHDLIIDGGFTCW